MGHRIYQRDADAEDYDDDDNDDMHSTYLQPSCHHTSPQHPTAVHNNACTFRLQYMIHHQKCNVNLIHQALQLNNNHINASQYPLNYPLHLASIGDHITAQHSTAVTQHTTPHHSTAHHKTRRTMGSLLIRVYLVPPCSPDEWPQIPVRSLNARPVSASSRIFIKHYSYY